MCVCHDMQAPVAVRCLWTNCYTLPLPFFTFYLLTYLLTYFLTNLINYVINYLLTYLLTYFLTLALLLIICSSAHTLIV